MKWTTTQLVAVGSVGVLVFLSGILGTAAASVTGLVGIEAFINVFVIPILMVFGMLLVPRFGTLTMISFIIGVLSLPVAGYGPPGFLPKVPVSVLSGLLADMAFLLLRQRISLRASAFVAAGPVDNALATAFYIGMIFLFPAAGIQAGFESLLSPLPIVGLVALGAVAGVVGGLAGLKLYKKLENTAVVKRIQA